INFEFQKGYDKLLSFQVYNFIGKKVLDLKSVTQKMNIPLADFYRGVYIYQLRDNSGKIIESGKFQVIK
ncbi:MAG: T9SS type A sorting domain-containing protein, partial [Ginsengibacter sp.]